MHRHLLSSGGADVIIVSDLAEAGTAGIRVQACGDANIASFDIFVSPEGRLVFDICDFDETMPVPVLSSRQAIPSCWKVRQNRMNMSRYKMESSVHRHGMRYSSLYILLCMAGHCSLVKAEMKES